MIIGKNKEKPSVSLVVPVFGGENIIVNQLDQCEKILKSFAKEFEIIVSDDKSKDNTAKLLKKNFKKNKKFKLKFNKKNVGIAKNIKTLYSEAKYEYICLFSADGDWEPIDIKRMVKECQFKNADIVIGKRNKIVYSNYRRLLSFVYNLLPKFFFQVDTIDAASIKVIKKSFYKKILIKSKSIFFEAELIIRAKKLGYVIVSIPVKFKRDNKKGYSMGKTFMAIQSLKDILYLRLVGLQSTS